MEAATEPFIKDEWYNGLVLLSTWDNLVKENNELRVLNSQLKVWVRA